MARSAVAADLQPIDRLEEKIRQLVGMIDTLRADRARAVDEATRLQRELDGMRSRLSEATGASAEVATLREEREVVRNRVVQIHGQRYAVRSELEPQYVGELASYVDEKMRQAARELASADPLRVAVVAALNIADDLYNARAESSGTEGRLLARAADIERLVDAVLAEPAAKAG
jgi:cell division protein ZapA